jgi:hypothetical protein
MRRSWMACLLGGLVLASPDAWAGHPQERQGIWIGFAGG